MYLISLKNGHPQQGELTLICRLLNLDCKPIHKSAEAEEVLDLVGMDLVLIPCECT